MNYTTISISDLRERLPEVAERVAGKGEVFAVEKWGKIKAYLVPKVQTMSGEAQVKRKQRAVDEMFGMYERRKDWQGKSTAQIVQAIRDREEKRYAHLLD